MDVDPQPALQDPTLEVMNFLNEAVSRYPQAISFAPGRPLESLLDVPGSIARIGPWVEAQARARQVPTQRIYGMLGQYGKTNGLIQEQLVAHLAQDEGIKVPPAAVMVTTGCQEAMLIVLLGLFTPGHDVLLVSDPTYIGITGLARILGIEVVPIPSGEAGLPPTAVEAAIRAVQRQGKRPRAVYDIPGFNNPLGTNMPLSARQALLTIAQEHQVLIFEDNPYGLFAYDGEPPPTLKSLDPNQVVVYLGSFAKTIFPGLRLGYLVADQQVSGKNQYLAEALACVKSLTTVNTTPLAQAIAASVLEEHHGSLRGLIEPRRAHYQANRDHLLAALERAFGTAGEVRWNRPQGGFFLTMTLPFAFDQACLESCARDYGVICCPMSFFALQAGYEQQIRLSFSYVSPAQIDEGIARLARFVTDRMAAVLAGAQ